ncbi:Cyclin-B1-1 [Raphanus sativus]|uniref:Cyclin-B1-1 n=1 Tax=Raphanus sativus TaxID=3726 RepID=A0A6J0MCF9_RAPSA|nr:cyclin-B1-1 [Raphanus sativus]KAJ4914136.1 Cyclin-B1-1 [Raphanus sativus]
MMASRSIVPQQTTGDVVVIVEDDDKNAGGKGRNRQVLRDIGNVVRRNHPKNNDPAKVNHPRTRSQRAPLVELNKPVARRVAVPKPKKRAEKPKDVEVIEISSDSDEERGLVAVQEKKAAAAAPKKKTAVSYTSVLTARSKAASGLEKRQKEKIVDIDSADAENDLAAVEYVEDIYSFYKSVESEWRPTDYMRSQPEINEKMRFILVEWLVDVCVRFELNPETFYLTVNIMDRFLSAKPVPRKELQLVGLSALLMSSKYEEIWPPQVGDLVDIADHAYSHKQVLVMEKTILSTLEWYLTVPTHYVFLARFIKASIADQRMENMVHYLAELGVMHYDTTIMFSPSMVAAAAIYAARSALHQVPVWTDTLKHHTGYSESQLMDCAKLLAFQQWKQQQQQQQEGSEGSKKGALRKKYSKEERFAVAMIPPAKSLLTGTDSA